MEETISQPELPTGKLGGLATLWDCATIRMIANGFIYTNRKGLQYYAKSPTALAKVIKEDLISEQTKPQA